MKKHFSVIILNDDKDILKDTEESDLGDMLQDKSAYLILIPKSQDAIIMSSSSQYECLCFFKDVKKLRKSFEKYEQTRHSMLMPFAGVNDFVSRLNLISLEQAYGFKKSIEVTTIDRILCDEDKHLSLRDLPSFYASANGLLNQMKF